MMYQEFVEELWSQGKRVARLNLFKRILSSYDPAISSSQIRGSHDYIVAILEILSQELCRRSVERPLNGMLRSINDQSEESAADEAW